MKYWFKSAKLEEQQQRITVTPVRGKQSLDSPRSIDRHWLAPNSAGHGRFKCSIRKGFMAHRSSGMVQSLKQQLPL